MVTNLGNKHINNLIMNKNKQRKAFILEEMVNQGSEDELSVFDIPLKPAAIKIKSLESRLCDIQGEAVLEHAIISGQILVNGLYVDDTNRIRSFRHLEPIRSIISMTGVAPQMRLITTGQVENILGELIDPNLLHTKVNFSLCALASKAVITTDVITPSEVIIAGRRFLDLAAEYTSQDTFQRSKTLDVAEWGTITYFVQNTGTVNAAEVQLELSPNGFHWKADALPFIVTPKDNAILVPTYFLRYTRLRFRSALPGQPTRIHVWIQGQA